MRVALVGPGTLGIPPVGWGATQRDLWNIHQNARDAGFESLIVNSKHTRDLVAAITEFQPDVIDLHACWRLHECGRYLRRHPTPLVVTNHDARLGQAVPREDAPSIEAADTLIALSPAIEKRLRTLRGDRVRYIPNGVNPRVFRPLAKKAGTVAAVGRNAPRKRFAEVAQFFLAHPEYHLTLCGPGMRARAGQGHPVIPTGPNITLLEEQPEEAVARLLGESEYFVHLCEVEASVLVVREAMACACRVWTVSANAQDVENVALSWEDAVSDPELGQRAAREARDSFDWSIITGRYAEAYDETLARWRGSPSAAADARGRYRSVAVRAAAINARERFRRSYVVVGLRSRISRRRAAR
jgi:glycosyltransferase involved in cell wall biosynthesis